MPAETQSIFANKICARIQGCDRQHDLTGEVGTALLEQGHVTVTVWAIPAMAAR